MARTVTIEVPDWVAKRLQVEEPDKVVRDWLTWSVQVALEAPASPSKPSEGTE